MKYQGQNISHLFVFLQILAFMHLIALNWQTYPLIHVPVNTFQNTLNYDMPHCAWSCHAFIVLRKRLPVDGGSKAIRLGWEL